MKTVATIIGIICLLFLAGIGLRFCAWANKGVDVAFEQADPQLMLQRYEWFKNASAQLDKKQADILVFENRLQNLKSEYGSESRKGWAREDREQFNLWQTELAGVKASYNGLAAEYNANMAKFNFAFTNAGSLPKGADKPLPKEYKPYENK